MIARSVSLTIITKDFASSRASLEAILARHHGYSAQLTASTAENAQRSITACCAFRKRLAATLMNSRPSAVERIAIREEVTQQHADLVARLGIRVKPNSACKAIRCSAPEIADVLAVEEKFPRAQRIEEMEAEQKR
jgi:hypothetical protein